MNRLRNPNKARALTLAIVSSMGLLACGGSRSSEHDTITVHRPANAHIVYRNNGTADQITHTPLRDDTETQRIHLRCTNGSLYAIDSLAGYNYGGVADQDRNIHVPGKAADKACNDDKLSHSDHLHILQLLPDDYVTNIRSGTGDFEIITTG